MKSKLRFLAVGAVGVLLATGLLSATTQAAPEDLVLASRATGANGVKGNGVAFASNNEVALSANGRFVAFASKATNLASGDTDTIADIFVRHLVANTTTLISRASGASGAKSNGLSDEPAISADGRFVTFTSEATNLPGDTDSAKDVFVRDRVANTTALIGRATGAAGASANGTSELSDISDDGRFVAFASAATNLPSDSDATADVFLRDRVANVTTLVGRAGTSGPSANANTDFPSISGDGRRVSFSSSATNLNPEATNGNRQIYVRDVIANDECPREPRRRSRR